MQGNPDGFETVRKIGNDLEKSGQPLQIMTKYISIYLGVFYQKLVGSGWLQATPETKIVL